MKYHCIDIMFVYYHQSLVQHYLMFCRESIVELQSFLSLPRAEERREEVKRERLTSLRAKNLGAKKVRAHYASTPQPCPKYQPPTTTTKQANVNAGPS